MWDSEFTQVSISEIVLDCNSLFSGFQFFFGEFQFVIKISLQSLKNLYEYTLVDIYMCFVV